MTSTSEQEQEQLMKISQEDSLYATLLPIKTVGVQVIYDYFSHIIYSSRQICLNKNGNS